MFGARRYHFNRYGSYIGYIDEDGKYFLCDGTYRGSVTSGGTFYDENGQLHGRVDVQGQYWGEDGVFLGYFRGPSGMAVPPASGPPRGTVGRRSEHRRSAHS